MMARDRYLAFANSPFGKKLTGAIGLPQPTPLERFAPGRPDLLGPVIVGAAQGGRLAAPLAELLATAPVATLFHGEYAGWTDIAAQHRLMTGRFDAKSSGTVGSAVFDATGIADPDDLAAIYRFFHDTIRSIARNGRILVLGTPPEDAPNLAGRIAQRALEGIVRSLGKEAQRNIAAQLLYVAPGAEGAANSSLRFFLSPRSAYVSGQVVRIGKPVAQDTDGYDSHAPHAGRTVLVTGAARGIGAAIAEVFARDGAKVICLDVPQSTADLLALAQRIGGERLTLDITAPEAPKTIVEDAMARGGYDVVVHNAGITRDKTIANMTPDAWNIVMNVNLVSALRITEALLDADALKPNGRVVCVSSIAGIAGNLGQTNYAASKAGVIGMVQGFAPVLAARGATINAVAPGFIETQMTNAIPLTIREAGRRMNAMAQGGQPVDVAETISWFADPASVGLNGNVVRVCGQSLIGA